MEKRRLRRRPGIAAAFLVCLLLLLPTGTRAAGSAGYFPACAWSETSLVDGLRSVGADSSFGYRAEIALANGYREYRGTAWQNTALLYRLRCGALRKPKTELAPLFANQKAAAFLCQEPRTCKATAAAMALNLLTGRDDYCTEGLGGDCCQSIEGMVFTGSDGQTYKAVYKTDGYEGSLSEAEAAIDAALALGVPAVAAVHSTAGGTRHHWVLVLGRSGGDWLIADPARAGSGSIADNAVTMASRGYALGLADYDVVHYGYIAFVKT
jgi:hypothetical protein